MILAVGPLDVSPTAVLLLQPLFLLLSPMGGTAAVLLRTRTSEVSHSSPSATPLPRLPISESFPSGASPSSTASLRSVRRGQQTRVIGRGLYVDNVIVGTHEVHGHTQGKFLLIKLKKMFPPPDSWDPPAVSSHGRKYLLVLRKKIIQPVDSWEPSDLVTDLWAY